jgi:hypothetical protein
MTNNNTATSLLKILGITILLIVICLVWFFNSYKAGNLKSLGYPAETHLKMQIIKDYVDTLIDKEGYRAPEKWEHFNKLIDIDSVNNKRIYFSEEPEEMYLISFMGVVSLEDVYNPTIVENGWVATRERMPKCEEIRVQKRFKKLLSRIESMAKEDKLPDSLIYR